MQESLLGGSIEVICGPMFAGKTEEIIRRVRRLEYAKKNVLVFKPAIDDRYQEPCLVSHNKSKANAFTVNNATEILEFIKPDTDAVVIDEAQFFDEKIVNVAGYLADQGIRVIIGGLDNDFKGEPFGSMPLLLAQAEYVTKLTAICVVSGKPATKTQRLINGKPANYNDPIVLIGASESYEPRAREYHEVIDKPARIVK